MLTAMAYAAANGGIDHSSWQTALVSLGIAALGALAGDAKKK